MINKPVALVTCKTGSEDLCIEEIGNVLYPYDNSISIVKTKYRGLIITYSKLSPVETYKLLSMKEYGFVKNIIPIIVSIPLEENQLFSVIKEVVKDSDCVKIKLRVRGVRGLSSNLWRGLTNTLREVGLKHDPKCPTCLFVEVIDDRVYIGLRECPN